uniref:Caspase-6 n=1 Tax=Oryzias melastigma TaxID=30732 RepID=A0A3B3D4Y6_ORYME
MSVCYQNCNTELKQRLQCLIIHWMLMFLSFAENQCEIDSFNKLCITDLNPAEEYKMNHKRRGLALIFNHENFYYWRNLNDRNTFRNYDNAKQTDVLDRIHEAAGEDHADADCFLLVFLSHGKDNCVYTHDGMVNIQEITAAFRGDNCPSLVGKPKIFIFQACRGEKHDTAVVATDAVDHREETMEEVVVDASALNTLPAAADFIMCYSVAEGFFSHRHIKEGSWYIQDLCELLEKFGNSLEFTELLTLVNRKVAMRGVKMLRDSDEKKQVPCFHQVIVI